MNPQTAKKLMSDVPEMQDFVDYVKRECFRLNELASIDILSPVDLAVEVKARQRAIEKLVEILSPLLSLQDFEVQDKNEFAVDVN